MHKRGITRWLVVSLLIASLVFGQGTWTLAQTSGGISGFVTDTGTGKPLAGAKISVASPSQFASTTSDKNGRFAFLTLPPDTYTVSAELSGFDPYSVSGVNVVSGQAVSVTLNLSPALKTIAKVSANAGGLVKPGTTADVYSVNRAQQYAVQALGGGANLNNAYSAIASVPGVQTPYGAAGWGQTIFIRGGLYNQVGYEVDGVPINRAFDNYNSSTLSNLGQQELQVQTGGAGAGSPSSTASGSIVQVMRTGTYPGFADVTLGVGDPAFYHSAKFEIGGATPDRNFTYYVGLLGYNQAYRYYDQFNGGTSNLLPSYTYSSNTTNVFNFGEGLYPKCVNGVDPFTLSPGQPGYLPVGTGGDQGCGITNQEPANLGGVAQSQDRENVVNLHIGIPFKNGLKDDVQLLYNTAYLASQYYGSLNDYTPSFLTQLNFGNYTPANGEGTGSVRWADGYTLGNVPFGTPASQVTAQPYLFPSSPQNRPFDGQLPSNIQDGESNSFAIVKVQYQHNFSTDAYARVYYYTLYSNWFENAPVYAGLANYDGGAGLVVAPVSRDYELDTHTKGAALQLGWQINSQNLTTFTANYTTASVMRLNNTSFTSQLTTQATSLTDGTNCYSVTTGAMNSCYLAGTYGTIGHPIPTSGGVPIPITGAAAAANAQYVVTNNGLVGTYNTVSPVFTNFSLTDEWRPNAQLYLNVGLRLDNYQYNLPSSSGSDYKFWFNQAANTFCYDLSNGQPLYNPIPYGAIVISPTLQTGYGNTCGVAATGGLKSPTGRVDPATGDPVGNPNGQFGTATYSNVSPSSITSTVLSPRLGLTYTVSPDTVVRFSGGEYTQPYNTATTQYLNLAPKTAGSFDYTYFWGYGFTTPAHEFQPVRSWNFDLSLEQRIPKTNLSVKLTPFYRYADNVFQDFLIGPGFVSSLPTGNESAYGAEFQLQAGDPNRDGFAGLLSYTYQHAFYKFTPLSNGQTVADGLNVAVNQYNALTAQGNKAGQKGAPCYVGGVAADPSFCTISNGQVQLTPAGAAYVDPGGNEVVVNPYYLKPAQGYFNSTGPYPVYQTFPSENDALGGTSTEQSIVNPHIFAGYLNYRKDRFAITPSFQLLAGSVGASGGASYGSPFSTVGEDPRTCVANQTNVPTATNPGLPNFTSCLPSLAQFGALYIPDPYTGRFDGPGDFQNPWYFDLNAQLSYDLTKNTRLTVVFANIYQTCFGGRSEPWTQANPPQHSVCGYNATPAQISNYYNGSGPNDVAANGIAANSTLSTSPAALYPYQPVSNGVFPFTVIAQLQFRL